MTNELIKQLQHPFYEKQRIVIGLSPDFQVRTALAGDEHLAELTFLHGQLLLRDLGGTLPVLVNGNEISGRSAIAKGDVVKIGNWVWTVPTSAVSSSKERIAPPGLSISLRDVQYDVQISGKQLFAKETKTLLRGIDLDIKPGEFVGIIGSSGSGKSTLIRVLNGDNTPTSGQVVFNHRESSDYLRTSSHKMAYLPQELILHEALTPQAALTYTSELRSITNASEKVTRVLQLVGMSERADVVIRNLSGGQKKRVALASELLNDPAALFLDEATSGLDPASEREMMQLFRQLADSGITTVCITHFPNHLVFCDRLLVVNHGVLVYDGTPQDVLSHFNIRSMDEIYSVLQSRPTEKPMSGNPAPLRIDAVDPQGKPAHELIGEVQSSGTQLPTLLKRYLHLFLSDAKNIVFLLLQAPIIATLIGLTLGKIETGFVEQHASDWKQVAFLLVLAVTWCSSTNGCREIVKEKHIYRHERRYRLNGAAYLLSKFILLGIIGTIQAWTMMVILIAITGLDTSFVSALASITLLALAGTCIGLMISSSAKTSEQAITILPIIVIAQAVYSGGIARMTGLNQVVAMLFTSSFWGLESLKSPLMRVSRVLLDATLPGAQGVYLPPILGIPYPLGMNLLAMTVQILVVLSVALVVLTHKRSKS